MTKVVRRVIGIIEVDSGTVVVGDPAYTLPSVEDGKPGIDYAAVTRGISEKPAIQLDDQPVVLLSNFGGDGPYPVIEPLDSDDD